MTSKPEAHSHKVFNTSKDRIAVKDCPECTSREEYIEKLEAVVKAAEQGYPKGSKPMNDALAALSQEGGAEG